MPKPIKKKSKAKEKDKDAALQVRDTIADLRDTFQGRKRVLVTYGVLVLGIIIALAGVLLYQRMQEKKAVELEYAAYKLFHGLYIKEAPADRYQQALNLFRQAYERNKSSRLLLYSAQCQIFLKQPDEALKTLNDLIARFPKENEALALAYQKIASIAMDKNDRASALAALDNLAKLPGGLLEDLALVESAWILNEEGKFDEAATKYRELANAFPDSPYAAEAKLQIGETEEEKKN